MRQIMLDDETIERLHGLRVPIELVDEQGRFVARIEPVCDVPICVGPGQPTTPGPQPKKPDITTPSSTHHDHS